MITGLDHIVILVRDLDTGIAAYQTLLARNPNWRSEQEGVSTGFFTLDNITLELLAPSGSGPTADRVRTALAEQGEGLASLAFRVDDIARMHRRLKRLALEPEDVAEASSLDDASGSTLSWKRTRASTKATHGVRLFFLELTNERQKSSTAAAAPVTGLDHVVVSTPEPDRAAALYGARLGLDMALDRTNPAWGARLMFFRCGDLVVEVVHRLGVAPAEGLDKLWGVSWRVADVDATRTRLLSAGLDVSEVRSGRKPGTRVITVKSGACGVPTLMIERSGEISAREV